MRLLLDTHTFIWFFTGNSKLSDAARLLMEDVSNDKQISIASIWEMEVKQSIGKLNFGVPFREFIEQQFSLNDFNLLTINLDHLEVVSTLPLHHRDPFNRLIISRAMVEQMPVLSADSALDAYSVHRVW